MAIKANWDKSFLLFMLLMFGTVFNGLYSQTITSVYNKANGNPSPFCPGNTIVIRLSGSWGGPGSNCRVWFQTPTGGTPDTTVGLLAGTPDSIVVIIPNTPPYNSARNLVVERASNSNRDTISIQVNSLNDASFSYPNDSLCEGSGTISPTASSGNWTFSPSDGALTGTGDVNTNSLPGGKRDIPILVERRTTSGCRDTFQTTIWVISLDNAYFNLGGLGNGGGTICQNASNPVPAATAGTLSPGNWTADPGIVWFDQLNGIVDLLASTPGGPYAITYTTTGFCPDSDTDDLEIDPFRNAYFEITNQCRPLVGSVTINPSTGGIGHSVSNNSSWVISPSGGLNPTINSGNGNVTINNLTNLGGYRITRTTSAGGGNCGDTYFDSLFVVDQSAPFFVFNDTVFCPNDVPRQPDSIASGGLLYTFSSTSITVGNGLDPLTGEIDPALVAPGTHGVTMATTGTSCPGDTTRFITLKPMDDATFFMSATRYCINDVLTPPASIPPSSSPGTFIGGPNLTGLGSLVLSNSSTGVIDLTSSGVGNFFIYYQTTDSCPTIDSFPVEIYQESALFHYDTTQFCELASGYFPQPTIDGTGGGRFYDPTGSLTPALDSISGRINLGLISTPGTYTIRYMSGGLCRDSSDVSITIIERDSATFDYASNPFCYIDSIGVVTSRSDSSSGGRFMSFIPGDTALKIDSITGEIDLHNTPPGFYAVKYVSDSTCPDSSFMIIQVQQRRSIAINYVQDRYCKQDNDPVPAATGTGAGTGYFYCADPDIVIDSTTGRVDLGASLTGMYVVEYVTANPCSEIGSDTIFIDDQARVEWNFLNNISEFCVSDPNPFPILDSLSDTTGIWYVGDTNRVKIDSVTGQIFLSQCIPNDSSNTVYVLTYSVDLGAGTCPSEKSRTFTIAIPDSLSFFSYDTTGTPVFGPSTTVCKSRSARFAAIFGPDANRSGYFTGDSLLIFGDGFTVGGEVRSFTGEVDLDNTPPGTYIVTYNLAGTCITAPTHTITILPADSLSLATTASFYCKNLANPLLNTAGSNPPTGGNFIWSNNNPGSGDTLVFAATLVDVKIDLTNSDEGSYTISYISGPTAQCPDTASVIVDLGDVPTPILVSDAPGNEICDNDTIVLDATNLNVFDHDFFWHLDSLNSPQLNTNVTAEFQYVAVDPFDGSIFYSIAEDRDNGCRDTAQIAIIVHPIPDGVIDRADTIISSDIPVSVEMLSDAPETYFHYCMVPLGNLLPDSAQCDSTGPWDAGQIAALEQNFTVQGNFVPASVTVYITPIAFGCVGETDSVTIKLNPSDQDVFVPGLITPNGDNENDYWKIQVRSGIPLDQYSIVLLNRSGGVAYEMFPLDENWSPNSLPDGVYWWVLKRSDSGEMVRNGGVTIRRK